METGPTREEYLLGRSSGPSPTHDSGGPFKRDCGFPSPTVTVHGRPSEEEAEVS